ncbi:uncharacterized protein LOC144711251 [Wolffia australiana]
MEEIVGIDGWEVLHAAGSAPVVSDPSSAASIDGLFGIEGESSGAIKPDYFSLDPDRRYSKRAPSEGEDSLAGSDNPSWVDPELESRFLEGFQEAIDGGGEQIWDFDGVVDGDGESAVLGAADSSEFVEEANPRDGNLGFGEKSGARWWKLPIDLLKFFVLRIRPSWTISFAAALVGLVLLKKRLNQKKPNSRGVPINLRLEDKKSSVFLGRAARLNEVVKKVPMIRSTFPAMGVTPFPVVAWR